MVTNAKIDRREILLEIVLAFETICNFKKIGLFFSLKSLSVPIE